MPRVCSATVEVRSYGPLKLFDVTEIVQERVSECGVRTGVARIDVKGATPALLLVDEEGLDHVVEVLTKLVPVSGWRHGNAYAHLISTIVGTSLVLAVDRGKLVLPEKHRVFMLETRPVHNHVRALNIVVTGD